MEWAEGPASVDVLTVWFQMWVEGFVRVLAVVLIGAIVAGMPVALVTGFWRAVRRERFWCRVAGRQVDVQFHRRRPFGPFVLVASCTAFDPAGDVCCARCCTDPAFRAKWEPATPVSAGGG